MAEDKMTWAEVIYKFRWPIYSVVVAGIIIFVLLTFFTWETPEPEAFTPYIYELGGVVLTSEIYAAQKTDLINKVRTKTATYKDVSDWRSLVNRELEVCKLVLTNVNSDNIVEKLNAAMGKCSK